jgi:hypothetical protein
MSEKMNIINELLLLTQLKLVTDKDNKEPQFSLVFRPSWLFIRLMISLISSNTNDHVVCNRETKLLSDS